MQKSQGGLLISHHDQNIFLTIMPKIKLPSIYHIHSQQVPNFKSFHWTIIHFLWIQKKVTNFLTHYVWNQRHKESSDKIWSTSTHCTVLNYLEIYISWKIRLCVVDLEGKFQTNLQAKPITFFCLLFTNCCCTLVV